jgi:hypothetical protein
VRITDAERQASKAWLLRPCDIPWGEFPRLQAERRKAANAARMRKERQDEKAEAEEKMKMRSRDETIRWLTDFKEWREVSEIVKEARSYAAFQNGRTVVKPAVLRTQVNREIDRLEQSGELVEKFERGKTIKSRAWSAKRSPAPSPKPRQI